jgi:hypothetical protein
MRAVRRRKRIVDIDVTQCGESAGEFRGILLFAFVKAKIFKERDLPRLKRRNRSLCFFADAISGKARLAPADRFSNGATSGRSDKAGSCRPLGRWKWDITTTLAPFWMSASIVGASRSIRVASVTTPSLTGTLRSARNNTRFPRTSRSSSFRNFATLDFLARAVL